MILVCPIMQDCFVLFLKPLQLQLKVCTLITSGLFDLKSSVVVYRSKTTKKKKEKNLYRPKCLFMNFLQLIVRPFVNDI